MAPSVVQHAQGTAALSTGTTGTASVTLGAAVTPGNCLVVEVSAQQKTASGAPVVTGVTIGGSADNFASALPTPPNASNTGIASASAWIDPGATVASTAVVVSVTFTNTMSGSNQGLVGVDVYEVSGVAASSPVDAVITHTSNSSTSWSSAALAATSVANEIAFAFTALTDNNIAATLTPAGSPWVNATTLQPGGGAAYGQSGYRPLSTQGTAVTYTGTISVAMGDASFAISLLPSGTVDTAAAALAVTPAAAATLTVVHSAAAALAPAPVLAATMTDVQHAAAALARPPVLHATMTDVQHAAAALARPPVLHATAAVQGTDTAAGAMVVTPVFRAVLVDASTPAAVSTRGRGAPDDGHSGRRRRRLF
jgi:hypothetical protein